MLGELATDLLGISPDEYNRMREISDRLSIFLGKSKSGETLFELLVEIVKLRSLLTKYRLFQTLAQHPQPDVFADDDFPALFEIPEEYQEEPTEEEKENLERQAAELSDSHIIADANKYREIVHDIYAFNQTMFWFIDQYLGRLKKLDKKNCAAALYDFLHNPHREKMIVNPISDDGHVLTISDPVNAQHVPRADPGAPDEHLIYEYIT